MMRDRFNLAFASILLVVVAVLQVVRARTVGQSPWKGGGFGMFSTSDSPGFRFVRCVLIGSDGEHHVIMPGTLSESIERARAVPTQENESELGRAIFEIGWVREDWSPLHPPNEPSKKKDGASVPGESPGASDQGRADYSILTYRAVSKSEPPPPSELLFDVEQVRIEVWRMQLDAGGTRMEAVLIRAETVSQ